MNLLTFAMSSVARFQCKIVFKKVVFFKMMGLLPPMICKVTFKFSFWTSFSFYLVGNKPKKETRQTFWFCKNVSNPTIFFFLLLVM